MFRIEYFINFNLLNILFILQLIYLFYKYHQIKFRIFRFKSPSNIFYSNFDLL
jgi:hypothetical protein